MAEGYICECYLFPGFWSFNSILKEAIIRNCSWEEVFPPFKIRKGEYSEGKIMEKQVMKTTNKASLKYHQKKCENCLRKIFSSICMKRKLVGNLKIFWQNRREKVSTETAFFGRAITYNREIARSEGEQNVFLLAHKFCPARISLEISSYRKMVWEKWIAGRLVKIVSFHWSMQ